MSDQIRSLPLWIAHYGTDEPGLWRGRQLLEELGYDKNDWKIWQCMADADDQGPYFGSGAHGLDVNFFNGTLKDFEKEYIHPVKKIIRRYAHWKYNRRLKPA